MKKLIIISIIIHYSLFTIHFSEAQVLNVPADYPTIQSAVDAAGYGDTVLVAPGTYQENIKIAGNSKILTLASHFLISGDTTDIDNTIIDASQPQNPNYGMGIMLKNMDSTLVPKVTGFTITGGTGYYNTYGGGIYMSNAPAEITGNKITECSITGVQPRGGGIYMNCLHEIKFSYLRNNVIKNCTINCASNTIEPWGAGIAIFNSHVVVEGNSVSENYISGNETANGGGGGISVFLDGLANAQITIEGNSILNNSISNWDASGAGLIVSDVVGSAVIHIQGNTISGNVCTSIGQAGDAKGAGIYIFNPTGGMYISDNTISGNSVNFGPEGSEQFGGGIYIEMAGQVPPERTPLIENNVITGNSADKGGGMIILAKGSKVVNNFISGNLAEIDGAGIYYFGIIDDLMITECVNNTLTQNTVSGPSGTGGAIYLRNSPRVIILNDLFYGNSAATADEIYNFNSTLAVYNCDINTTEIEGNWNGDDNFNEDPELVDGMIWDCADPGPCWDAGIDHLNIYDTTIYAPATCIQGNIRPMDQAVDVGACEVELCTGVMEVQSAKFKVQNYPNPTQGIVDFRWSMVDCRWSTVHDQYISMEVYNAQGQLVSTVLDGMCEGDKVVRWDAGGLPAGVYYYRLTVGGQRSAVSGRRSAVGSRQSAVGKIVKY